MTQRLLILGGGFGLYGYLPAGINSGWQVSTLEKYQPALKSRVELHSYESKVNFVKESDINLSLYDGVVIARTPEIQSSFIAEHSDSRIHMFLEKPLAMNFQHHLETLNFIEESGINFSVAYLFRYQSWYVEILKLIGKKANFRIMWTIPAGGSNSWKNDESKGGGLFSYYGVHILSLLLDLESSLSNVEVNVGENEIEFLSGDNLSFSISLNYGPSGKFEVKIENGGKNYNWLSESPFGMKPVPGVPDPRIDSLSEYLTDTQVRANPHANLRHEWKILEASRTLLRS